MTRRICLMAVANDFLPTLVPRLPQGVVVMGKQEHFDRAITNLRLEGPGLPEWCDEPPHGGAIVWAAGIIGGDGILRIVRVGTDSPANDKGWYERLIERSAS